jgi:alpha-L-fucosidase
MSSTRRAFLAGGAACLGRPLAAAGQAAPNFLQGYEQLYAAQPRAATVQWFREARFGLFIHYGLYSLEGRHEWLMFREKIRPAEYAKLAGRFTAEKFDAGAICDLALAAGMKYVNLVTKHCDSFCLWDTKMTDFNSVNSPAKRDLVAEMARACQKRRLGLFLFYEHGFDWRHPHGPAPWDWKSSSVRPAYDPPDPWYAPRDQYDFQKYLDYASGGIRELLTNYGPVAGIWLDGAGIPASGDRTKFRCTELYAMIRGLQPQALISYKWGIEGSEDFVAPEKPQVSRVQDRRGRPMEVCWTTQKGSWGWRADAPHYSVDEVWAEFQAARKLDANLLLNIGPLGDGSVHPEQRRILLEMGRRIRDPRAWLSPPAGSAKRRAAGC